MKEYSNSGLGVFARPAHGWITHLPGVVKAAINLLLLALWVRLYWPVFQYLAVLFTREEFRTNLIVLASVIALLLYHARKIKLRLQPGASPGLFVPGLVMMAAGTIAYLLVERFLDINTLSAFLFGFASYGLLGLWLAPERWRQGFPAMLLVVGVLPFGEHLETFVGYPLRVFTAMLARSGLGALGFHSVGVDTILVFESGISQVDIPCSGVKSLWTGALFLLAATWIQNRRINLRWILVALATGFLLVVSNLLRVTILALTGPALEWTLLARMLHVPLGVLGFVGTCTVALALLNRLPEWKAKSDPVKAAGKQTLPVRPSWLGPLLLGFVLVMLIVYSPRPAEGAALDAASGWSFSERLRVQPAHLSVRELEWIRQGGADLAERYTFEWMTVGEPVKGTLMLLTSQTWRGQHRPERCFEVFGLTVSESSTYLSAPDFPLRYLTLTSSGEYGRVSAAYWLQSANRTTEDFGQRIWADLASQRERWVLVTVLFDREYSSHLPEINELFASLRVTVQRGLTEGRVP